MESAPVCLKGRVEGGQELPVVEVGRRGERKRGREGKEDEGDEEERLRAVARFVVAEMKGELVVELAQAMGPVSPEDGGGLGRLPCEVRGSQGMKVEGKEASEEGVA